MNVKIPIKIAKAQLDSLLQYARDSGYEIVVDVLGEYTFYAIDCKKFNYGTGSPNTPLAVEVKNEWGRTHRFMYLRLPLAKKKSPRRKKQK